MENSDERYLVPAVERAIKILELFKDDDELSLTDIANKLMLSKSSVFRILKTLHHANYLEQNNNLYSLGSNMLDFVVVERKHCNLLSVASLLMEKLTSEVNETTKLGIIKNDKLMIINRILSNNSYNVTSEVGNEFPIHAGAASKLMLAYQPQTYIDAVLSQPLEQYTENTITNREQLLESLSVIREQGYAIDREEYIGGIRAIACPIRDYTKQVIAALSIPYLASKDDAERFDYLLSKLLTYSKQISRELGYIET